MKPKFEIGDKVIEKEPCFGGYGYVTYVNHYNNPDCYVVKFANGEERVSYIEDFCVDGSEIKDAFLTRLQELLATFDAEIVAIIGEDDEDYKDKPKAFIQIGDEVVNYERDSHAFCDITAKNVFDYDKD